MTRYRLVPCFALGLTLALAAPPDARAEINVVDSVEWMTADSDLVVRGAVQRIHQHTRRGRRLYTVTLRVMEVLKPTTRRARSRRTVRFAVGSWLGKSLVAWKKSGAELLVFLARSEAGVRTPPFALRRSRGTVQSVVRLSGPKPHRLYTMGFQVLARRADLLRAVGAAARTVRATRSHRVDVPGSSPAYRALWGGSAVWMYVPRGPRLQRLARTWLRSASVFQRVAGVKALATHRSQATVRSLRGLLRDPGHFIETRGPGHRRTRVYAVRAAAYEALRSWRIPVRKPVLRVPMP